MAGPPESLLKWAALALGEEATVESVTGLHDGSRPWRLRVVSPAATTDAILRTSFDPPGGREDPWRFKSWRPALPRSGSRSNMGWPPHA